MSDTELVEKVVELMERRKLIDDETFCEYALVERNTLEEIWWILYDRGLVSKSFDDLQYCTTTEEH